MILSPTPFLGWNGVYKLPINHVALASSPISGSPIRSDIGFRVSTDGETFATYPPAGDLAKANVGGASGFGAFVPTKMQKIGSRFFLLGRLVDDGNNSRSAIFVSDDLLRWTHKPTSIDGAKFSGWRAFVGIAGNDSYIVALQDTGSRAVSVDGGDTWTGYSNVGFTGSVPATAIAASNSGFVSVGKNGQMRTAVDPRSTWTSVTSRFGTDDILDIVAGSLFCAVGASGKCSTAALTNLSTWTLRSTGTTETLEFAFYGNGRFFAAGFSGVWLTSLNATSWSVPADKPGSSGLSRVRSGYYDGSVWHVHWGSGDYSHSSDGEDWTDSVDPNLIDASYFGSIGTAP